MTRKMCLLINAILLLAVAGCKDDSVPTINGGNGVTFPHEVGSLWTYEYVETEITVDDTTVIYDTVDVVVIKDTVLGDGDSASIWVFRYDNQAVTDTQIVSMSADTVRLEWDTDPFWVTSVSFIWPIDTSIDLVGGAGQPETTSVSGPISVSVAGGSFSDTYWIVGSWTGLEEGEETDIWLAPNVGIIWYRFHFVQQMPDPSELYQVWELLSYDLP